MRKQFRICIIIAVYSLIFTACGQNILDDPADWSQSDCLKNDPNDPTSFPRPSYPGGVIVIRLTNDGRFVDRCELTNTLYELNWERRPRRKAANAVSKPKVVILYIHGWKHSYSNLDSDLLNFRTLIDNLNKKIGDKKQVLGVYVGWNGASRIPPFNFEVFNNMTFWTKSTISDRIAQTGVVTKIIGTIASVLSYDLPGHFNPSDNQFIAIGHSFGARMLFSATNQTLIYQTERAHPGTPLQSYSKIEGVANTVILVNPAFEAARFTPLASVTRHKEIFPSDQRPLLLSISSETDWPTKYAFPVGQFLGGYTSKAEQTTLGNYEDYQTHSLKFANYSDCGDQNTNDLSENFYAKGLCLLREGRVVKLNKDGKPFDKLVFQPNNPFLVALASSEIINGHNDIWNKTFSDWLFSYIEEVSKQHQPRLLDANKISSVVIRETSQQPLSVDISR